MHGMATVPPSPVPAAGSTPAPLARRYWEGLPRTTRAGRSGGRRPWTRLGRLVVVVGVVEAIIVAGVLTDWFGVGAIVAGPTSTGPPLLHGPNPDPYGEKVNSLAASIVYSGNATGYFPDIDHANVCHHCPLPPTILWDQSPPQALFPVFFNITNTGSGYHEISNFTLSAAHGNPNRVFELFHIYCCSANNYDEDVEVVGFLPGQTIGIEAYIVASNIPSAGGGGYDLMLTMDSPS